MKIKNNKNKKILFIILATLFFILISLVVYYYISGFFNKKDLLDYKGQISSTIYADLTIRKNLENYLLDKDIEYKFISEKERSDFIVSERYEKKSEILSEFSIDYALVVNLTNYLENISLSDLKKIYQGKVNSWSNFNQNLGEIKIMGLDEASSCLAIENILQVKNLNYQRFSNETDLFKSLSKNKNALAILPIDKIDPSAKVVMVDDFHVFKNPSDYPLKISYKMFFSEQSFGKYFEKIKEALINFSFDYQQHPTEVIAVGDIMLSRHVGTKIRQANDNSLPFRKLYKHLSQADIAFANLESPFFDQGPPITSGMVFKAEPETIEGLKLAGFDIVSLANNHFGDQGRAGMNFTFDHLARNNIQYFGAGRNKNEAYSHKIIDKNGYKFSFLSFNSISPESYRASPNKTGLAWVSSVDDLNLMELSIKKAKNESDFLIVSFHWGNEYTPNPTLFQKNAAKKAVEAGADIILAQHPHVVQAIEYINNKPVFYSLGNFVFDQMWSLETREGIMVRLYILKNKLLFYEIIPIFIEDYNQPQLATSDVKLRILDRMFKASF